MSETNHHGMPGFPTPAHVERPRLYHPRCGRPDPWGSVLRSEVYSVVETRCFADPVLNVYWNFPSKLKIWFMISSNYLVNLGRTY